MPYKIRFACWEIIARQPGSETSMPTNRPPVLPRYVIVTDTEEALAAFSEFCADLTATGRRCRAWGTYQSGRGLRRPRGWQATEQQLNACINYTKADYWDDITEEA